MRIESSVTTVSWIPSEAVSGPVLKGTFDSGITSYDDPPGDTIDDLEAWRAAGAFRFANRLAAWVEIDDGRIVDAGYRGGGLMGSTTVRLAKLRATFEPVALPDLRREPERSDRAVRFVQTTGGRTGLPAPRRVKHPPFVQFRAPTVWTTLALTIRADGTSSFEVLGASKFPRHWVYDADGKIAAKVGLADFKDWYRHAFGKHTPWGDQDSSALVTAVETALERQLSVSIMSAGERPEIRSVKKGKFLVEQGDPGDCLYLLLDGMLRVTIDGEPVADVGPGVILGERAGLEGGVRTASLFAATDVRVRGGVGRPDRSRGTGTAPRTPPRRGKLDNVPRVRIATWNVNSLKARQERVEEWLGYARPDVLCLQETKLSDQAFPHLAFSALGYDSVHHGQGQWNGVAILSRVGIDDVTTGFDDDHVDPYEGDARVISATCAGIRVVSVYVPNGREVASEFYERKLVWLAALHDWLAATSTPAQEVTVLGDFNVAPEDRDVWSPKAFAGSTHVTEPERAAVARLCEWGMVDVFRARYDDDRLYSYWDYRRGDFHEHRGMRIDLVLATPPLAVRTAWAVVDRNARKGKQPSDHAPVIADFHDRGQ